MTDLQAKFLEVSKQYEAVKNQMKELKPVLQGLMLEMGTGSHFQDPSTNAVYEIVEPPGTYIYFDKISYNRTKVGEEKKGSLAMKKAEEMGYKLK